MFLSKTYLHYDNAECFSPVSHFPQWLSLTKPENEFDFSNAKGNWIFFMECIP